MRNAFTFIYFALAQTSFTLQISVCLCNAFKLQLEANFYFQTSLWCSALCWEGSGMILTTFTCQTNAKECCQLSSDVCLSWLPLFHSAVSQEAVKVPIEQRASDLHTLVLKRVDSRTCRCLRHHMTTSESKQIYYSALCLSIMREIWEDHSQTLCVCIIETTMTHLTGGAAHDSILKLSCDERIWPYWCSGFQTIHIWNVYTV